MRQFTKTCCLVHFVGSKKKIPLNVSLDSHGWASTSRRSHCIVATDDYIDVKCYVNSSIIVEVCQVVLHELLEEGVCIVCMTAAPSIIAETVIGWSFWELIGDGLEFCN